MSVDSTIYINLARKNNEQIFAKDIFNTFINNGWRVIDDNGKAEYSPLGDDECFDWQYREIEFEQLIAIINEKERNREIIGVTLKWGETERKVVLLIHSELKISIDTTINRKKIICRNNQSITDMNWYLERSVVILKENGYIVEVFTFEECI